MIININIYVDLLAKELAYKAKPSGATQTQNLYQKKKKN
jgi:hypothetical protein